jgi:hypothetical protein
MAIDKPGQEIVFMQVVHLLRMRILSANAHDDPMADRHVSGLEVAGEYIQHSGIDQQELGLLSSCGHGNDII